MADGTLVGIVGSFVVGPERNMNNKKGLQSNLCTTATFGT
jgi:hypothetical protein